MMQTFHGNGGPALLSPYPVAARPPAQSLTIQLLDVAGGLFLAVIAGLISVTIGSMVFQGVGWSASIGWETSWLIATIALVRILPSGIDHDISWSSSLRGLGLDWPELLFAGYILWSVLMELGAATFLSSMWGPLGLALSVGAAEEMIFRVIVLGWLVSKLDVPVALTLSAFVFGVAHLNELSMLGLMSVLPQFAGGMVLGACYLRTRNPVGPILAHAAWDFPLFVAFGLGTSGGGTEAGWPGVGEVIMWTAFAVYGLWLVRESKDVAGRVQPRVVVPSTIGH
jgi:membrane protease YdiL (CAAX protease family)